MTSDTIHKALSHINRSVADGEQHGPISFGNPAIGTRLLRVSDARRRQTVRPPPVGLPVSSKRATGSASASTPAPR